MCSDIRRRRSPKKTQQILRGALLEFLQNGYSCSTMDKIANTAGVSKQTLYSHFLDKEGLFTALIQHVATQKFQLVWSSPLEGEPKTVLRDLAERLLTEINDEEYISFIRLIVAESGRKPDLARLFLSQSPKPAVETLTRYFQEHPELQLKDPEATARIFVGSLVYYIIVDGLLQGRELMPLSSERLIDTLVDLVLNSPQK